MVRRLNASERTVENHLSGVYPKRGATGRTQAFLCTQLVVLPTERTVPGNGFNRPCGRDRTFREGRSC
ncbi:hypothetical protein ACFV4F_12735 [Kitasatospora sp. NPDC059722]|uniref:hypothetical protein n=1 Tax=unclassified Kitasatospora TaxID=2633591 RepID=UPI0036466DEB